MKRIAPHTSRRVLGLPGFRWILCLHAGWLAAACGNKIVLPDVHEVTVAIEGTVTDASNGNPVVGALMEIRTSTTGQLFADTTTDINGDYALSFLYRYFVGERPFCPFTMFVSAPDHAGTSILPDCTDSLQVFNLQLIPF